MLALLKGNFRETLSALRTLFTSPAIGLPTTYDIGKFPSVIQNVINNIYSGLPIYTYKYEEKLPTAIGKQMVLINDGGGGTQTITDNVAPEPREWLIEGYLKADVPAISMVGGLGVAAGYFTNASLLMLYKTYFRWLRTKRVPFQFWTTDGESVLALMKTCTFIDEPENMNSVHIRLELMEYVALQREGLGTTILSNSPKAGSAFSSAATIGAVIAKSVVPVTLAEQYGLNAPLNLVQDVTSNTYNTIASISNRIGGVSSIGNTVSQGTSVIASLGTIIDEFMRNPFKANLVDFNDDIAASLERVIQIASGKRVAKVTLFTAENLVEGIKTVVGEAKETYLQAVEKTITINDSNVVFTFRKNLFDGKWWIDIAGTLNNEVINTTTRLLYNSILLRDSLFSFTLRSAYIDVDEAQADEYFYSLTEAQQYDAISDTQIFMFIEDAVVSLTGANLGRDAVAASSATNGEDTDIATLLADITNFTFIGVYDKQQDVRQNGA